MKATLFLTTECNLGCDYCYIGKRQGVMSEATLERAVAFAFRFAAPQERCDFGLFGGEPMLYPDLVRKAVTLIREQAPDETETLRISLVTNGTLMESEMLRFLAENRVALQVSCDGVPRVQDRYRRFRDGSGSAIAVAATLRAAVERLPSVIVNAVYGPKTHRFLPETVDYLAALGIKQIVLNPDFGAPWRPDDIASLEETYRRLTEQYVARYREGRPLFISLIDEKIAVILRGGYAPGERCRMGHGEFAFSPEGYIYPCERLVGDGTRNRHTIGHLDRPGELERGLCGGGGNVCKRVECRTCGLADYCMNWCGCSNFMASGDYGLPSHFICASERLAVETAHRVLSRMEDDPEMSFVSHFAGLPMLNSARW